VIIVGHRHEDDGSLMAHDVHVDLAAVGEPHAIGDDGEDAPAEACV
jgi:hypothetical protein